MILAQDNNRSVPLMVESSGLTNARIPVNPRLAMG